MKYPSKLIAFTALKPGMVLASDFAGPDWVVIDILPLNWRGDMILTTERGGEYETQILRRVNVDCYTAIRPAGWNPAMTWHEAKP